MLVARDHPQQFLRTETAKQQRRVDARKPKRATSQPCFVQGLETVSEKGPSADGRQAGNGRSGAFYSDPRGESLAEAS